MKNLLITATFIVACVTSYSLGYKECSDKHYEAACLQADFIRYIIDHFDGETEMFNIGRKIENSYEEFFGDLDEGIFKTKHITNIKDFDQYSWCY